MNWLQLQMYSSQVNPRYIKQIISPVGTRCYKEQFRHTWYLCIQGHARPSILSRIIVLWMYNSPSEHKVYAYRIVGIIVKSMQYLFFQTMVIQRKDRPRTCSKYIVQEPVQHLYVENIYAHICIGSHPCTSDCISETSRQPSSLSNH